MDQAKDNHRKKITYFDASNLVYGKVPPQAIPLEEAVLGACMIEKEAYDRVINLLKPADFYTESHQRIFSAMQRLNQKGQPIDLLMVVEELRKTEELDLVGGPHCVSRLTNCVVSSANIEQHAFIVNEKARLRALITLGAELITSAFEDSAELSEVLQAAENGLNEITKEEGASVTHIDAVLFDVIKQTEELRQREEHLTGIPTGYRELDRITCGWQETDLIILAARPSKGKTAKALNFLKNAVKALVNSKRKRKGVGIFSLEMSANQLVQRLLSNEAEIYLSDIKTARLDDQQMKHLYKYGIQQLAGLPIYIDDRGGLTLQKFKAAARFMVKKGCGMLIIDYLQLMFGDTKSNNREQEISSISRGLKNIAKELKVPIIALAQLSREVEKRANATPQLSDLRESGSLEQDADMVLFLYGPSDSEINEDASLSEKVYTRIAKHRNGVLETLEFDFIKAYQRFIEVGVYKAAPYKPAAKRSFIPEANGFPKGFRNVSEADNEQDPF